MDNDKVAAWAALKRTFASLAALFGIIFSAGVITGLVAAHIEDGGGPFDLIDYGIFASTGLIIIGCGYYLWRRFSQMRAEEPMMGERQKLNRRIMLISVALGGVLGLALALGEGVESEGSVLGVFSNAPLPALLALALALFWGAVMPVVSYFWHRRAIDEQEADAYKSGALMAIYIYWYGAPVWWLLWRGGFLPEPNGQIIYMSTMVVALAVWMWKKYR